MEIKTVKLGIINENCYLISSNSGAVVIDPGYYSDEISDFLKLNCQKERLILITHCHFDHIGAVKKLSEEHGVKVGIGRLDSAGLSDPGLNLSHSFRIFSEPFEADILFDDNEKIEVGDLKFRVIFTPGHTKGSVCYLIGDSLFSGDTLFFESYGRTDFPGGNGEKMRESFYRLTTTLSKSVTVYPGHDKTTTIGHEIDFNPIGYMSIL